MKKIVSMITFCLCLIVLLGSHSGVVYAVDSVGTENSWQKDIENNLTPDLPLADILIPLNLLTGPILTEEAPTLYPMIETETKTETFSLLHSNLPPPSL